MTRKEDRVVVFSARCTHVLARAEKLGDNRNMNRDFNNWWPLMRRVLGWGLVGAALWVLPIVAFFGVWALYIYMHPSPSPTEDEWFVFNDDSLLQILFWLGGGSGALLALMGTLTGGIAGFCAPVDDSTNPLESRVFWSVRRQAFWPTFAVSVVCGLILSFLEAALFQFAGLWMFRMWLTLTVASSFLFLWRAVNLALAEKQISNAALERDARATKSRGSKREHFR